MPTGPDETTAMNDRTAPTSRRYTACLARVIDHEISILYLAGYDMALAGAIQAAKTCSKKSTASPAMVKGLMSQLTASVMRSPRGSRAIPRTAEKSTFTIIG